MPTSTWWNVCRSLTRSSQFKFNGPFRLRFCSPRYRASVNYRKSQSPRELFSASSVSPVNKFSLLKAFEFVKFQWHQSLLSQASFSNSWSFVFYNHSNPRTNSRYKQVFWVFSIPFPLLLEATQVDCKEKDTNCCKCTCKKKCNGKHCQNCPSMKKSELVVSTKSPKNETPLVSKKSVSDANTSPVPPPSPSPPPSKPEPSVSTPSTPSSKSSVPVPVVNAIEADCKNNGNGTMDLNSTLPPKLAANLDDKSPINWREPEELSHKLLVRQACQLTVDAVTRLLTETVSAIQDYHAEYRRLLCMVIELMEQTRNSGSILENVELLDCKMMIVRSRLEEMKKNIVELEAYFSSVERLALATAEAAYLGHAEYASVAMSERLQSALAEIKQITQETYKKERYMNELQSAIIIESGRSLK